MPLKYLKCAKTNDKVTIEDCKVCNDRCLSLPTLIDITTYRDWTGKLSTTQGLNGTRQVFLEITCDYTVDPFDRAFSLLGTRHHSRLEAVAKQLEMVAEEKLSGELTTGILDLLEPTDRDGVFDLWDYKTWGSFAVAKAMGIVSVKEKDMPTTFKTDPAKADTESIELQLNNYRIMLEDIGFKINKMYIQATVRDGGTYIAFNRGVDKNIYKIPVRKIDDDYVREFYSRKSEAILKALDTGVMPPACSDKENWGFNKCKKYCPVAEFCDVGTYQRNK